MNNDINIKPGTIDNIDFIYNSLENMANEEGVAERFSLTRQSLEDYLINKSVAEVIIAYENDKAVGFAIFSLTNRNFSIFEKPGIYLHDLYVLPDYRRHGVATYLKEHLKTIASDKGCGRIDYVILNENALAHALYNAWEDAKEVDYIKYLRINID